jgi:serine/threonine-protein kinase RsbT
MTVQVVSHHELPIGSEDDVVLVRRLVRALAQKRGFDAFAVTAVTTATSELTRNAWIHAGRGTARIDELSDGARFGLRIEFSDQGPGISNIEQALAGGFSTARSLGLGLSGTRRLVDTFHIESEVGRGTMVRIEKWKRF